ncbi:MAG: hypothetical protein M1815_003304 [Lichina confinis]|nr:MAG: hypothetical protein M1815_003304 [Lichina confinis]
MKPEGLVFLRPYLWRTLRRGSSSAKPCAEMYARLYATGTARHHQSKESDYTPKSAEARTRMEELKRAGMLEWPRLEHDPKAMKLKAFISRYKSLEKGQVVHDETVTLRGSIVQTREAGQKLVFLDVSADKEVVQAVGSLGAMAAAHVDQSAFRRVFRQHRRGDSVALTGNPCRTAAGELSVRLTQLPKMLSPCLHPIPTVLLDEQTRTRHRHVDLLVNPRGIQILELRDEILTTLRSTLKADGFTEVQTPIIGTRSGGAVARPFVTTAVEFGDQRLEHRIAPELWLKRLVASGMERIFEIGPCFRNEGIDSTHNPEFYVCEFYERYSDLKRLMQLTQTIMHRISSNLLNVTPSLVQPSARVQALQSPFDRIDFVPAIEASMGRPLPDLSLPDAREKVLGIFSEMNIAPPSSTSLPRLLDRLSVVYLEPRCERPTFVMYHPECLAPLAKSFVDPTSKQRVSARAELFVDGVELVNAYEEEISAVEQRRKFIDQLNHREDTSPDGQGHRDGQVHPDGGQLDRDGRGTIDESYVEMLEWGMPPTGGWGCGIDRLAMYFSGSKRIKDVLSFGTLRNVINQ